MKWPRRPMAQQSLDLVCSRYPWHMLLSSVPPGQTRIESRKAGVLRLALSAAEGRSRGLVSGLGTPDIRRAGAKMQAGRQPMVRRNVASGPGAIRPSAALEVIRQWRGASLFVDLLDSIGRELPAA